MDYSLSGLKNWCIKIEAAAKKSGLNFYPQEFEIVGFKDMIGYEAYLGMPSRYPHWSFGKAYDRSESLYRYNLAGLPYEMVINSNPCIAYLMKDNTLLLQILTMAHVYGHNDFFKNNRLFSQGTRADYTIEMFKNDADIIRSYINDPSIGYEEVEKILNAAHAVKFQTEQSVSMKKNYSTDNEFENDILKYIILNGKLSEWQKNVLNVVRKEALYFIPQVETKIMNEGWASYWHYKLLHILDLPQPLHLEFLKRHNDVITPFSGSINPYHLGFKIFEDLEKKYGIKKIFEVREIERDESFIRRYLTKELCSSLNLFKYSREGKNYVIDDISDNKGWIEIRNTLCKNCGMGSIPKICVKNDSNRSTTLFLKHIYDGRELDTGYTEKTLKYIYDLWKNPIELTTVLNKKNTKICCSEEKKVSYKSA